MRKFPDEFVWGTATASYQVEGAAREGGRGRSIWDIFSHTPGKVAEGHTGDVACDHYHRYEDDVQLMKELGISSYRFSIAWPRVMPEKGRVWVKGLDFYKRLATKLLENGIRPAVTMYHWDLPQWIEDEGGWNSRDTVSRFLEYSEILFREFGDLVPMWITHNEPWCASILGYGIGVHAPGLKDWRRAYRAAHHLLLSHGQAVRLYRELGLPGEIGITLNLAPVYAATSNPEDLAAADRQDMFQNRWFLDPVLKGKYPESLLRRVDQAVGGFDAVKPGDLDVMATPIDFLGVNYYTRAVVANDPSDPLLGVRHLPGEGPRTEMDWEVYPDGLYDLLSRLRRDYGDIPIYITENGAAYDDRVQDGAVHDPDRVSYLASHFAAAHRFLEEGGNLRGYYVWSLMDNFEWAFGYTKRFGLVYVDYDTLARIPKDSYFWYQRVIREGGLVPSDAAEAAETAR
ncbi:MAG: beta-glucosidase [Alicyclobacillus mali]|uniref:GH1 family beta-glucosidase n=1 Tax=Alicyclobacillus mali (ex Roth et al. 2021) TaxID=1123961 RepID=UPI0023EFCEB0|nr:GH1 family beta-glucosidase [Alicyclobacillus mali (ex Roth et al. 2021)]MCL6490045.1 beta-glucosidase [Alicyclobacillus mali (ex Roth et al. 2021)]